MRVDEIVEEQENEEDDDEAEVLVVCGQEANYDNEIIVEDNLEE